jgi:hypothetical protein
VHHIRHRARRGGHEITNLVELCWFHHRLVHEGGWNVRFDADGELLAITPAGNVLPRVCRQVIGSDITSVNTTAGLAIDEKTIAPRWYGDPLHLGEIVGGLEWLDERGEVA